MIIKTLLTMYQGLYKRGKVSKLYEIMNLRFQKGFHEDWRSLYRITGKLLDAFAKTQ